MKAKKKKGSKQLLLEFLLSHIGEVVTSHQLTRGLRVGGRVGSEGSESYEMKKVIRYCRTKIALTSSRASTFLLRTSAALLLRGAYQKKRVRMC